MKTLILTVALGVACLSGFAQGQLNFANFGAGANQPIFNTDGVTKLGTGFSADLYWGPAGTTDSTLLSALGQPASFSGSSGYFFGGTRTINGQPGGATITGQVRVWDTADGNSWAAAYAAGLAGSMTAVIGESVIFNIMLTTPPSTPNSLTGLNGHPFALDVLIPEPSAVALLGLGFAGMLVLRRRR